MHARLLAMGVATLALALAGCAARPESTVEDFYYAVADGDTEKAESLMSSKIRAMVPSAKLQAALALGAEQARECGGISEVEVNLDEGEQIRTGTATVTYKGSCPSKTEKVKLVKEDGEWKLDANK